MNTRPFRILVIDDQAKGTFDSPSNPPKEGEHRNPLFVLKQTIEELQSPTAFEILVSTSVTCDSKDIRVFWPISGGRSIPATGTEGKLRELLSTVDFLILDLGETGPLKADVTKELVSANLNTVGEDASEVTEADIIAINDKSGFSGIGFYHRYLETLKNCQGVFVLTRHDGQEYPEIVKKLIDPFCGVDKWQPYTAKFCKSVADHEFLAARIKCLFKLFREGYTKFDNLTDIEFAATHDEPVMIVGESGTGKEFIAKAIHERWAQERIRSEVLDPDASERFAVINCSVLSDNNLAESELFGSLFGSFTGPTDHSLGKLLKQGCGLRLNAAPIAATDRRPALENLLHRCDRLQRVAGGDDLAVMVGQSGSRASNAVKEQQKPLGTLFLDEFGDLPASVQGKLLRFLESWEVQMLGLAGVVKGACLRVIAATSDPRFAAFAGYIKAEERLKGQWRSEEEMSRPLRNDLLFRVKGQTIRATPVTEENVDRIVRHAIATKSNSEIWSEGAVQALVGLVRSQISAVEGMDAGDGKRKATATAYKPVFGHRREIDRFIRLIEAYRVNAEQCGSRSRFRTISRRDVEFIYRPSSVVEPGVKGQDVREPQSPSPNAYETACRRELQDIVKSHAPTLESGWTPSQLECLVKSKALSELAEAALKSFFLKHPEKPPGTKTRATDEAKADFLKSLGYSPSEITTKTTNKLIKRIQDWRKDWRAKK